MTTHLLEDGRSLCGQANEVGSGEPCRSCERSRVRRERDRAAAVRRAAFFARFVPGRLVLVESRSKARSGYYRITGVDSSPGWEWIDLVSRHGKCIGALLMREYWPVDGTAYSWELRGTSGGSQGCGVSLVAEAVRDPAVVSRELKRLRSDTARCRERRSYLRAELEASAGIENSAGPGGPGQKQED